MPTSAQSATLDGVPTSAPDNASKAKYQRQRSGAGMSSLKDLYSGHLRPFLQRCLEVHHLFGGRLSHHTSYAMAGSFTTYFRRADEPHFIKHRYAVIDKRAYRIIALRGTDPMVTVGKDIFTGTRHQSSYATSENVECLRIYSTLYTVIALTDNSFKSLKSNIWEVRNDLWYRRMT